MATAAVVLERKDRRLDSDASSAVSVDGFDLLLLGGACSDQEAAVATRESTKNMRREVILEEFKLLSNDITWF